MGIRATAVGVAVVAALALGAVACGGDGDGDSAAAGGGAAGGGVAGGHEGLRGQRYCEIIPVTRDRAQLTAWVYNTLGFNECPAELWDALTEEAVNEAYGSVSAEMNGPRHWTLDAIEATGAASSTGEVFDFGGIEMELRATVEMRITDGTSGKPPYGVNEIQRDTVFSFDAGQPVFELTAPDGHVYVMQAYAQIVDPDLAMGDLPTLGDQLALPEGWSYSTRVLDEPLRIDSGGLAHVVQDELQNSYQRRT